MERRQQEAEREAQPPPGRDAPTPSPAAAEVAGAVGNAAFAAFAAGDGAGPAGTLHPGLRGTVARSDAQRGRTRPEPAGRTIPARADGELAEGLARSALQRRTVPGLARQPHPQAKGGHQAPGKTPAAPTLGDTIWYWRVAERARRPVNVPQPERGGAGTDDQRVYKDDVLTVGVRVAGVDPNGPDAFPVIGASGDAQVEFGADKDTANGHEWTVRMAGMGRTRLSASFGSKFDQWAQQITVHGDLIDYKAALDRTSDLIQADILDAGANVNDAATAYKAAFDAQNKVLKAEAGRRKMFEEMLWQALFAGLGGLTGGAVGAGMGKMLGRELRETLRGGAAIDSLKDTTKSLTRSLVAMGKPATMIDELKLAPVSVDPFNFLQKWEAQARREGSYMHRQLAKVKDAASQAENDKVVFDATEDPYNHLAQDRALKFLKEPMSTDKRAYSKALWEQWLAEYGYEFIDDHFEKDIDGGGTYTEAYVATGVGRDSKLEDAIFEAAAEMGMSKQAAKTWYEEARAPALARAQRQVAERRAGLEPTPHVPGQPDAPTGRPAQP
jgi:hypothetical protein